MKYLLVFYSCEFSNKDISVIENYTGPMKIEFFLFLHLAQTCRNICPFQIRSDCYFVKPFFFNGVFVNLRHKSDTWTFVSTAKLYCAMRCVPFNWCRLSDFSWEYMVLIRNIFFIIQRQYRYKMIKKF